MIAVDEFSVTNDQSLPPVVAMDAVKTQVDGAPVSLTDAIVSWTVGDVFYVEKEDRSSGIRVVNVGNTLAVGDKVTISGSMKTDAGINERYIDAYEATKTGTGSIEPLAMTNKAAGGSDFGILPAGQAGVVGGTGLNNVGLLARLFGRVSGPIDVDGQTYYVLEDGSGVDLWVLAIGGSLVPGQYVGATGVISTIVTSGETKPLFLVNNIPTNVQAF